MSRSQYFGNLLVISFKALMYSLVAMLVHLLLIEFPLKDIVDQQLLNVSSVLVIVAPLLWGLYHLVLVQHQRAKQLFPSFLALSVVLLVPFSSVLIGVFEKRRL